VKKYSFFIIKVFILGFIFYELQDTFQLIEFDKAYALMTDENKRVNWIFSISLLVLFYFLRALRLKILLGKKLTYLKSLKVSSVTYFGNFFLLANIGEAYKIFYVSEKTGNSKKKIFAFVFLEKLLDVTVMFFIIVFYFLSSRYGTFISFSLSIFSIFLIPKLLLIFVNTMASLYPKFTSLKKYYEQLIYLYMEKLFSVSLLTIIMWIVNIFSVIIFLGVENIKTIFGFMSAFAFSTLGIAVPISPGFIGQYEFLWVHFYSSVLSLNENEVLVHSVGMHAIIAIVIFLMALPYLPGIFRRGFLK